MLKFFKKYKLYFLLSISAIIIALSFVIKVFSLFVFFAFIPFIHILYTKKNKELFLYSVVFILSFWIALVYWLYIFHSLALPMVLLVLSIYFLAFVYITKFVLKYFHKFRFLIIPFFWVSLEYLESLGYLGFPWGNIAVTQSHFLHFIQFADITGIWGISFLTIFINSLLLEIYYNKNKKKKYYYIAAVIFIFVITFFYGYKKLDLEMEKSKYKIALIQGNINPNLNWNKIRYKTLRRLNFLSSEAVYKEGADLIVWWETAIMDYLKFNLKNYKRATNPKFIKRALFDKKVVELAQKYNTPILLGIPDVINDNGKYKFFNSAVLIDTNSNIVAQYNKIHLVPFGEWFPFKDIFPFIAKMLESVDAGNYTPGTNISVFPFYNRKFSVLICYEGIFGSLARKFTLKGAEFFINITDDMWSFSKIAELQHRNLDIFRAIENRVSFLRCGNSGATCFISPVGKIEKSLPLFTPDYLIVHPYFVVNKNKTIYQKFGDWFAFLSLVITAVFILTSLVLFLFKRFC